MGMVVSQAFNGAGDTVTPTILNFICFWLIELPLAYWLARHAGLAETGVFYSVVVAESLLAVLGVLVFIRGKWKRKEV
jgi:Na+-driven multidrug efflux pump